LQSANLGDSAAFLKRGNGVLKLTRDHKPNLPEEEQRLINSGIKLVKGQSRISGLAVSRALGDHFLKQQNTGIVGEPFVSPSIRLDSTDEILIVASDGLWDVMTGEEAMELIKNEPTAKIMAQKLMYTALQNSKCTDNITVCVAIL